MARRSVILLSILALFLTTAQGQDWNFIVRLNPALDEIVPADAKVEKLAENFGFLEGPVWVRKGGYHLLAIFPRMAFTSGAAMPGKLQFSCPIADLPEQMTRMWACSSTMGAEWLRSLARTP